MATGMPFVYVGFLFCPFLHSWIKFHQHCWVNNKHIMLKEFWLELKHCCYFSLSFVNVYSYDANNQDMSSILKKKIISKFQFFFLLLIIKDMQFLFIFIFFTAKSFAHKNISTSSSFWKRTRLWNFHITYSVYNQWATLYARKIQGKDTRKK